MWCKLSLFHKIYCLYSVASQFLFIIYIFLFHVFCKHSSQVYRNKRWRSIMTDQLVPGDVVSVGRSQNDNLVPCDLLLLRGPCVVDESMLTGKYIFCDNSEFFSFSFLHYFFRNMIIYIYLNSLLLLVYWWHCKNCNVSDDNIISINSFWKKISNSNDRM